MTLKEKTDKIFMLNSKIDEIEWILRSKCLNFCIAVGNCGSYEVSRHYYVDKKSKIEIQLKQTLEDELTRLTKEIEGYLK